MNWLPTAIIKYFYGATVEKVVETKVQEKQTDFFGLFFIIVFIFSLSFIIKKSWQ